MCQTAIVLIIIGSIALCLATTGFFTMLSKLNNMADLCNRLRDKWASTETLCKKLDVAITWLIERKGVTIENTGSWVTPWIITYQKNHRREYELAWQEIHAHRDEIAQALYDALKKWDDEREHKWAEKTKGKKK